MKATVQLDLDLFSSLRTVQEKPAPSKHLHLAASPAPARMVDKPYEGFTNSKTWYAHLLLRNDYPTECKFQELFTAGTLTVKVIEAQFKSLNEPFQDWMDGMAVNWVEIAEYLGYCLAEIVASEDIPNNALAVLGLCAIEGNVVKLPAQLDRKLYEQVNRILVALGGKWHKKAGGHVYPGDPTDLLDAVILTGKVSKPEKFGYFPTAQPLAEKVVSMADIKPGTRVLEPSAGQGGLADEIAKLTGSKNLVVCLELQESNVAVLRQKGYTASQCDFAILPANSGTFSRIVMNPPFERQQDIIHVLKAWDYLKEGGRLVSIMSPGFTFRQDRRATEFRDFVAEHGHYVENPAGSFKSSGTNINTVTVILDKRSAL